MFVDNKYKKMYEQLIEHRRNNQPDDIVYCEKHHILPRSLGGTDESDNIVKLTGREHFIAHRLLVKFTKGVYHYKMAWALHRMATAGRCPVNSYQYEQFRKWWAVHVSENHPSKRGPEWAIKVSEGIKASWEGNAERKQRHSVTMAEKVAKWKKEDPEKYYKRQRKNSLKGTMRSRELHALRLEYNGKTYIGWRELEESTGVSKSLYKKYYVHGIDPSFRIGKDGPLKFEDVRHCLEEFCYQTREPIPTCHEDTTEVLQRMCGVGIITEAQMRIYMKQMQAHWGTASEGGIVNESSSN